MKKIAQRVPVAQGEVIKVWGWGFGKMRLYGVKNGKVSAAGRKKLRSSVKISPRSL
jgi:hypothetical protein